MPGKPIRRGRSTRRPKVARFKCRAKGCLEVLLVSCPDQRAYEDAYIRNRARPWHCIEHRTETTQ